MKTWCTSCILSLLVVDAFGQEAAHLLPAQDLDTILRMAETLAVAVEKEHYRALKAPIRAKIKLREDFIAKSREWQAKTKAEIEAKQREANVEAEPLRATNKERYLRIALGFKTFQSSRLAWLKENDEDVERKKAEIEDLQKELFDLDVASQKGAPPEPPPDLRTKTARKKAPPITLEQAEAVLQGRSRREDESK